MRTTRTRMPALTILEHELEVPLDHGGGRPGTLTVFAREVVADRADGRELPLLVFFQGGPGMEAPRLREPPDDHSFLHRALREYRVLLLDQRGTGRSTPVGVPPGRDPAEQAGYLTCFRADSIVRDAELYRKALGAESWSVSGVSFGGFCVLTYLSQFPAALDAAFVCGGLSPVGRSVDDVYARTYPMIAARCEAYYDRYPEDRERVRRIHRRIESEGIVLPTGERLTSRRFRQLGLMLGMADGASRLHHILELPSDSPAFLHDVVRADDFSRNPLFAVIHEACYADGSVTNWAAERLLPADLDVDGFTGEHVFSWMFEEYAALVPLREAAEILAEHDWPRLYDSEQLAANTVPTAAVIYGNDMYVPRDLSEETATRVGNLDAWLTNEYEHDGLRVDGARIFDRLIASTRR